MPKTYKFGIVGCGLIGDFHAKAIRSLPNAELVACYDVRRESVKRMSEAMGCKGYTSLARFLKHPGLEVVNVCTPSGAHAKAAVPAAAAGKHVVVEKPIDVTLRKVDKVIEAVREAGVKLCAIFPSRFSEANILLKRAVDAGRFGRLTLGDAYVKWWRSQEYYDTGGWKGTKKLDGGGALMNQSIHAVDALLWIMGPARSVQAQCATLAHERIDVEDTAVAAVEFASGALGTIVGASSAWPGTHKRIEISGDRGTAVVDEEDIARWEFADALPEDAEIKARFEAKRSGIGAVADPADITFKNHALQIADFLEAVETDREPAVNGPEGRKAVELILAIYKSAAKGRRVTLPL